MSEWDLQYTAQGVVGRRVFQRNDGSGSIAVASLPITVGTSTMTDRAGSEISGCVCSKYTWKLVSGIAQVSAEYEDGARKTNGAQAPDPGDAVAKEEGGVQWSVGGEVLSIPTPGASWKWASDSAKVEQPIYKSVSTGTVRVPRVKAAADFNTWLATVLACVGKVNSGTYGGFAAGQLLLEGVEGGSRKSPTGVTEYAFDVVFKFRVIGGGITSGDWQYLWREDFGGSWDRPKDGSNYLYATSSFSGI